MATKARPNGGANLHTRPKSDPYCAFRDDRERRLALISRDIRITIVRLTSIVAIVVAATGNPGPSSWMSVLRLFAN